MTSDAPPTIAARFRAAAFRAAAGVGRFSRDVRPWLRRGQ